MAACSSQSRHSSRRGGWGDSIKGCTFRLKQARVGDYMVTTLEDGTALEHTAGS